MMKAELRIANANSKVLGGSNATQGKARVCEKASFGLLFVFFSFIFIFQCAGILDDELYTPCRCLSILFYGYGMGGTLFSVHAYFWEAWNWMRQGGEKQESKEWGLSSF